MRGALNEAGRLGPSARLSSYRAADLTAAEKQDAGSYPPGTKVFFLRTYGRTAAATFARSSGRTPRASPS